MTGSPWTRAKIRQPRRPTKLEHALRHFQLDVAGMNRLTWRVHRRNSPIVCLQHGAAKVFAVDRWPGPVRLEKLPATTAASSSWRRQRTPSDRGRKFPQPFTPADLAVIDCSFISLRNILPAAIALLRPNGQKLSRSSNRSLKPAEARSRTQGRGVIRDPSVHERVLNEKKTARDSSGAATRVALAGVVASPLLGPAGQQGIFGAD